VKPDRRQSSTRVDGIQAAVTGLDGIVRAIEKPTYRAMGF